MPRFHIRVVNDIFEDADDEGSEMADLAMAVQLARRTAAGIIAEEIVSGRTNIHLDLTIEGDDRIAQGKLKVSATVESSDGQPFD